MSRVAGYPWDAKRSGFHNLESFEARTERIDREQRRFVWKPRRLRLSKKFCSYEYAKRFDFIPTFREGEFYTKQELEWMADALIFEDPDWQADGTILNPAMYRGRAKHEVYVTAGTPDPEIVSGLYWRTHPQGIPWRTPEERRSRGKELNRAFYKV